MGISSIKFFYKHFIDTLSNNELDSAPQPSFTSTTRASCKSVGAWVGHARLFWSVIRKVATSGIRRTNWSTLFKLGKKWAKMANADQMWWPASNRPGRTWLYILFTGRSKQLSYVKLNLYNTHPFGIGNKWKSHIISESARLILVVTHLKC
jgi:hypothetical protein